MEFDHEALIRTYLTESEEQLRQMEEALVHLESRPDSLETMEGLFRVTHTLKGNAATVGFSNVAEFAHALEDALQRMTAEKSAVTADLITLLLRAVDALREMVAETAAGDDAVGASHREVLGRLAGYAAAGRLENGVDETDFQAPTLPAERRDSEVRSVYQQTKTLRVGTEKLDEMLNLTGEIAIAHGRLRQTLRKKTGVEEEVLEAHRMVNTLFTQLQEQIMKVRMIPVGPTFRQYIRMVRDLAQAHGKTVQLVLEGEEVEVDITLIEHLRDPLTHMLRNAIDHGIEPPDRRKAAGKEPCGRVTLRAFHDSGNIVIQMEDDGAGLNRGKILKRGAALGLVSESQVLSDEEVYSLIFETGFSTADAVTDLSGRGVGMDVVRRKIDALRGAIDIQNRPGSGALFTIRLPLTLAVIEGFEVGVGDERYVIPLESVVECIEVQGADPLRSGGSGLIHLRGKALPCFRLKDLFRLEGSDGARESVVVVQHESERAGIVVDALHGESQAVIKSLGKVFPRLVGISGSTILGNGRVALILDVKTLLRHAVGEAARPVECR